MTIPLGFEVSTGKRIEIPLRHTAVFGQTQESGKTTTLEGLISRSGLRGLAFVTKRGESSFHVMNPIAPYFRERTDWRFVAAILEATLSEKLKFQRSWIMKLCQAGYGRKAKVDYSWPVPRTLADVQTNVQTALKFATGMNESVYTELAEYLKEIIPQIDRLPYTTTLELAPGVNVMDLSAYDFPLQALVVRSSMEWIRKREHDCVLVVPESHKFAPKQRGSPVKLEAEDFIRESAALRNFLWIDCQDVAGVADVLLRQIGVWIFGVQRARHEIERTLDAIPEGLLARRPRAGEIATLSKGQFFVCWGREMWKVYVQPAWMSAAHAEAIARGEEEVESAREILKDFDKEHPRAKASAQKADVQRSDPAPGKRIDGEAPGVHGSAEHRGEVREPIQTDAGSKGTKESEEAMRFVKPEEVVERALSGKGAIHSPEFMGAVRALLQEHYQLIEAHDDLAKRLEQFLKKNPSEAAAELTPTPMKAAPGKGAAEISPAAPSNGDRLDEIYTYVKVRAQKDPGILQLLATKIELRVQVEPNVQEIDGNTFFGRIASLLHQRFFREPQPVPVVLKEAIRRGWCSPKTPYIRVAEPLDKLTTMGFLTNEGKDVGYRAVEGMKVNVVGA